MWRIQELHFAQEGEQPGNGNDPPAKRQRTGEPTAGLDGHEDGAELGQRWRPAELEEGQVHELLCTSSCMHYILLQGMHTTLLIPLSIGSCGRVHKFDMLEKGYILTSDPLVEASWSSTLPNICAASKALRTEAEEYV